MELPQAKRAAAAADAGVIAAAAAAGTSEEHHDVARVQMTDEFVTSAPRVRELTFQRFITQRRPHYPTTVIGGIQDSCDVPSASAVALFISWACRLR